MNSSISECQGFVDTVNYYRDPFVGKPAFSKILVICLYAIIASVGSFGNLLVIAAVIRNPQMRTTRNYFIINLATSDFLMCSITVPFTLYYTLDVFWELGNVMCKIVASLQGINVFVSTLSITSISFDRYLVITTVSRPQNKLLLTLTLAAVWGISVAMSLPMLVWTQQVYPLYNNSKAQACGLVTEYKMCAESFPVRVRVVYTFSCFLLQYMLPLSMLAFVYAKISKQLSSQRRFRSGALMRCSDKRREDKHRQHRANMMITLIVAVFAIVWLPLNLFMAIINIKPVLNDPEIFAYCHMMGMLSACANPIFYGVLNENFRLEFMNILRPCILCRWLYHAIGWRSPQNSAVAARVLSQSAAPFLSTKLSDDQNNIKGGLTLAIAAATSASPNGKARNETVSLNATTYGLAQISQFSSCDNRSMSISPNRKASVDAISLCLISTATPSFTKKLSSGADVSSHRSSSTVMAPDD